MYVQLRCLMTDLSKDELSRIQEDTYIPHGLIPRPHGGLLIQEGDDNIDINCETVDGKGTLHSMARVVFQEQTIETNESTETYRVKIGHDRSLPLTPDNAAALKTVQHFEKPKQRSEPPRIHNAKAKILELASERTKLDIADLSWVIARMIHLEVSSLPTMFMSFTTQTIPFWTGYNATIAEKK